MNITPTTFYRCLVLLGMLGMKVILLSSNDHEDPLIDDLAQFAGVAIILMVLGIGLLVWMSAKRVPESDITPETGDNNE